MNKNNGNKKSRDELEQPANLGNQKNVPRPREELVHGTAGGEMPDPKNMPSHTKFHSDTKKKP